MDGITKDYLAMNAGEYDIEAIMDSIAPLTFHELLQRYSDKAGQFVAFKTTKKGRAFLMNAKSMHRSTVSVLEA
jgi:hypothetical protein